MHVYIYIYIHTPKHTVARGLVVVHPARRAPAILQPPALAAVVVHVDLVMKNKY